MEAAVKQKPMQRKPILMPQAMIKKVNGIAKENNVSFAKVVRDAVNAFDGHSSTEEEELLEALAETMIETTKELTCRISELEKRTDETHAILRGR